jgi:hypothetical protein
MADRGEIRIGRTAVAALASLSLAAIACGSGSSLPSSVDASVASDATTKSDAAASRDSAKGGDATTGTDAASPVPDAGSLDARGISDAGPSCTAGADGACVAACAVPLAPDLSIIANDEVLKFVVPDGLPIELAVLPADASISTAVFQPAGSLSLAALSGLTRVLAQSRATGCVPTPFNAVYDIRATYAPAPPDPTTTAIAYDDPRVVAWATGVDSYLPGPGVSDPKWMMPSQAFGPAGTDTTAVVVLGNGGSITLTFASPITDGDSWDFAVFENSFASDVFLELGFVEVSSDGSHFARFDSAFQSSVTPCGSCSGTAAEIGGLAGTYMVGDGTPFDLAALRNSPLVRDGSVDLTSIRYVRIVDIVGDGTTLDSFGRGIVDPITSGPTAGFDLDGVAVLNQRR